MRVSLSRVRPRACAHEINKCACARASACGYQKNLLCTRARAYTLPMQHKVYANAMSSPKC